MVKIVPRNDGNKYWGKNDLGESCMLMPEETGGGGGAIFEFDFFKVYY